MKKINYEDKNKFTFLIVKIKHNADIFVSIHHNAFTFLIVKIKRTC